jgi:hypothetical protein
MDKDKTSDPKPTLQLVKKESDLTIKQRAFADAIIKGKLGSFKEVYADVYDVTLTKQGKIPKWVEVEASRLMAHPKVSLSIQQGLQRREVNAVASTTRTRSYVLEQLMRESKEAESDSSRNQSIRASRKNLRTIQRHSRD